MKSCQTRYIRVFIERFGVNWRNCTAVAHLLEMKTTKLNKGSVQIDAKPAANYLKLKRG